jgi:hypothetical protein
MSNKLFPFFTISEYNFASIMFLTSATYNFTHFILM